MRYKFNPITNKVLRTLTRIVPFIVISNENDFIKQRLSKDSKVISLSEEFYNKNNEDILNYIKFRIIEESKVTNHYARFVPDLRKKSEDNLLKLKIYQLFII